MKLTIGFTAALLSGLILRAETGLFEAVRNGDVATMRTLLRSGADPNSRNYIGATPLMYASAFASAEFTRLLLDSGADVNATSKAGATALMWATGDTANVRLLLERDADVNAKAKDGTTALVSAALRGNVEAMRLLIARGADAKASASELLRSAYSQENPEIRRFLAEAGVESKNMMKEAGALPFRGSLGNPGALRKLLDAGADPNAGVLFVTVKFPVLGLASFNRPAETVRVLIEGGADPNRPDTRKRTPLMMAVSRTVPDTALVRLLIAKTADINARDDTGRTALDWALTQGETDVASMLREAGGRALAQPAAAPRSVEEPREARAAVEQALDALLPASVSSFERWKCVSCHNQSLPAIAAKLAGDHGIPVHSPVGGMSEKASTGGLITEEDRMLGRGLPNIFQMLAFAERGAPANFATDAMVHWLADVQRADGSWQESDLRPPLAGGTIHPTALAIRALSAYAPPAMRSNVNARIARARDYLARATSADTQDEAFKLLGFVWSQAPDAEVSRQTKRLLELQRADGGWSQLPAMASDAFATGEALYALHWSGLATGSKPYKKGADYLRRTQLEDGTWFVRSRAFGFQPYLETGFPHGVDQFISAAATSWAVIALAYTL